MSEDILEQMARVNMMARDADGDWDLSPNDRAALRALLDLCGERALTPKAPTAQAESELPDGWEWENANDALRAVNGKYRVEMRGGGILSSCDGQYLFVAPIAVVLAVIARNK